MGQPKRKDKEQSVPETATTGATPASDAGGGAWRLPTPLSNTSRGLIAAAVLLFNLPLVHYYLLRGQMTATAAVPYRDDFSRFETVAENYWSSGGLWRVVNGQLLSPGVKNNPLWLRASLPENVAVEFDARSESPEGDIKVEIFGDGSDHASGYVLVHGGWNNSVSIIARLDEHGASINTLMAEAQRRGSTDLVKSGVYASDTRTRVEAAPYPVQIGRTYRWRIERRGSLITWSIDGVRFMQFDDPLPLKGKGHDRFGFSSWEAQLYFDNLSIEPL